MAETIALRDSVSAQMKAAMKAGDKTRVGALRLVIAALKDREIEARGSGKIVSRADELALLTKMVKSRQELLAIYQQAKREDLADQESAEIAIIGEFLPKQLDEAAGDGGGQGGDRRDGRGQLARHGQGRQRAERALSRPDGLRQGERDRQGAADRLGCDRSAACAAANGAPHSQARGFFGVSSCLRPAAACSTICRA